MDLNPIHHPSPAKTVKCSFLYYIQHLMLARLVNGLEPHPPPLSSQKNEMLIFWLCSTSDDQLGWSMDSNPICHPLQPIKWNATFWIMFNFWCWTDWSMDSNPIYHPSPANKMKYSFLDYVQLLMISWASRWTQTPFITPLQPIKWSAHFLIMFNFWWSAGLVNGLKPHPPALSSQNSEMLIFVIHSTSDVGQTGQWTWTSSTTPLQPKNEMLIFGLCSSSDD